MGLWTRFPALISLCTLITAPLVTAKSLSEALKNEKNITTFLDLLGKYPDVYEDLPEDVTIIAPNDGAFVKGQGWDADEDDIPAWLTYGIINRAVVLDSMSPGDTRIETTLLNDTRYSNVSDGQKALFTMQPGGEVVLTSGTGTHVTVVKPDIAFDNGLIHIVESLPVTPQRVDVSMRNSYTDLSAFLGALYATGLVDEFADTANVTILAPHNRAFQRLGSILEDMDESELRRVLRYHLITGTVLRANDMDNGTSLITGDEEANVHITRFVNDIYANTARVIQTDLLVANGIVQMLDDVLNVEEDDVKPNVTASAQLPVFSGAEVEDELDGELDEDAPVPFTSALPCTEDCLSVIPTGTGGGTPDQAEATGTDNAAPLARCSGQALVGNVGVGLAVGVLGAGLFGGV